ncbi:hypothetical protein GRF29_1g3614600 [Pseudopithomyces chartarum]|uniref:Uncharacterized protein n=1 Tax=Pseudopithomyces chartarum TaxID=1892770 RepID=A0AAN6MAC0_9PLEO|nr:hypothetical protein GRF29_1g3614600 [Pseudopithomyces chartarum]
MSNFFAFRKGGIPALASSGAVFSSPCLGSLNVEVNEPAKQAIVELQFRLPLHGFDDNQCISFVYDGSILQPGTVALRDVTAAPEHVDRVARPRGGSKLLALQLALATPCVVLLPSADASPKTSDGSLIDELAALAKATIVTIIFDSAWLHPAKASLLRSLEGILGWTGCPRDFSKVVRRDWTIFSPGVPASPELPPYTEKAKRPRQSPASSPRRKRLLLDADIKVDPGSPTEKATTTSASSPRLDPSSPFTNPFDPIEAAAETAIAKLLPNALRAILPEVLPDVLTRMFTLPASTPPPQPMPAPPNPMSPLHRIIRDQLNTRAEDVAKLLNIRGEQLANKIKEHGEEIAREMTSDAQDHALGLREAAELELEERLEDYWTEMADRKEDGLMEINRLCDAKVGELEELHQMYDANLEELEERTQVIVSEAYATAQEMLDEFAGEQRMELVKAKLRMVDPDPILKPIGRASSVPLGLG